MVNRLHQVFQPWDGGRWRRTMYLPTVDSATSIPSINNSPWIRGAPHSGFSRLIRRISPRTSESTRGRLPRWRDFQRQYARKPRRYQPITVSSWTMIIASRSDGYSRYSHTNSKRSMFRSLLTRVGDLRRRTTSCWHRRRFSASSRARRVNRDRMASSSWARNATIDRSITTRPAARHLG